MNLLENLNEQQRDAVQHTEGPLLILAGAGSGKTRVITHRIASLVKVKSVSPYAIFAVTFTNKAAEEMRKRIRELIGPVGDGIFIKTFHSASVFILRHFGVRIGIAGNFSIYDDKDQQSIIKEILLDMRLDPKRIRPASIVSKISEIKDRAEISENSDVSRLFPKNYPFNFHEIYTRYQEQLSHHNALDFNDLLIKTVILLRDCPDVLARLHQKWRYFMVDEYQDTNHAQYLICKYLSSSSRNLCVVGDDDQSIYSWRGADIRNILDFEKDFAETKVITLEDNYRSTEPILQAASSVIRNNNQRKEKLLRARRGEGEMPVWCRADNEYAEAEYVVSKLQSLKTMEHMSLGDFAVFYRTNAQSRVFEEVLRRENIAYRVIGGLKFYDRKEIKDIISYLKFIANTKDTVALLRIINVPARGIGSVTVEKIRDKAYSERVLEWDIISSADPLGKKTPSGLVKFRDAILECINMARSIPAANNLSDLVQTVIDRSGYRKHLESDPSRESQSRLENIDEFITSVFDYESRYPDATLDQFLQEISLLTSEDSPENENIDPSNAVTLMTVHNAKGLEFTVVFLTGMEEGIFPHINSSDTEEGLEEERRLCYVGITRSKDRLFLTSAEIRRSYAGVTYQSPSRFIQEIPSEHLMQSEYSGSGFNTVRNGSYHTTRYIASPSKEISSNNIIHRDSEYSLRERVLHPKFGSGRIVSIAGSGDNVKLTIAFGNGNTKTFLEKYTPLEKID